MVLCDHLGSHGDDLISTACAESQNLPVCDLRELYYIYLIEGQIADKTSTHAVRAFSR